MKTLFRGGTVVSGRGTRKADVLVDGETILQVARTITPQAGTRIMDITGKLLLPGFIDAHTHFDLDVAGTTTADDFASGSLAALRGGTTTIIDFACPNKGETLAHGLKLWHEKADGKCACDYGFHMTIDDWNEGIAAEIDDMYAAGISSFKMYMTYPAMMIGDAAMYRVLKKLKEKGGVCGVHCENSGVIDALVAEKKAAGENAVSCHPETRPPQLEAEAVSRLLRIAETVDIPVVIVHLTNAAALHEVEAARKRGQRVYVETCPQYLVLDESVYDLPDYREASQYVCSPPIRTAADQRALWAGLRKGEIQTVSTDHCSFTLEQKEAGRDDFTKIPGGVPGVETRAELIYTYGVTTRKISLATMCRTLSENPAKLYGMYPRKGVIAAGADADLVIYDPAADHELHASDMAGKAGYTPYEGFPIRGGIQQVWLRGQLVAERGNLVNHPLGKYIPRGKCVL
jgi:dihydropyrimidinase